jgi:hypothetical protein
MYQHVGLSIVNTKKLLESAQNKLICISEYLCTVFTIKFNLDKHENLVLKNIFIPKSTSSNNSFGLVKAY